ncbi:nitric oxide synthase oxygenase [Staphylococcus lugdunensis]|uniref:nitric oxide synthase oxygenase n=1 Tax=Staphylococcus TaxID=1279 RepID=UPI0008A66032|nr:MULTISPECIES: nitric oxide synthase oxygenase [Staphylococcus]ARJ13621.1 nitric oxide synthase [Staphylococcus lugdunensis]MCH8666851.1 nitric oxide synthase oxygenase [Staphylococcus lugdunensis]OFJ63706.1 nitric oxide synthase [Staphylococcus sp. HMSC077E11]OFM42026.1 nitric oxide synthase [Staphylococcus sp. HMSC077E12]OFR86200.1 nitric oxide synthase [Staphylococcus sp. HMSC059F04]
MLREKAIQFIQTMYKELKYSQTKMNARILQIEQEIEESGIYTHTLEELTYGAKMAWRNSNRCIGRLFWESLNVIDARDVQDESSFINSIHQHLSLATNGGKIKPTITIFSAENPPKIFNNQIIRYAGYDDMGDPAERDVTRLAQHLGWQGNHTDFDVLPLIFQIPGKRVTYHELPSELVKEVDIKHEHYPKLKALNLKWYAVPIISNMNLVIGGITYTCAPFNGWYMVTEIAVRNFTDSYRYNLLEKVADAFNFDTLKNNTFNKDRALVELNYAVYHSFKSQGVSIVDHLTASKQFELFQQKEAQAERQVTGKWSWLAPPLSPTLTDNYHHGFNNEMKDPNFYYKKNKTTSCPFH